MPYIKPEPGYEAVISGISGRYPSCRNIRELKEKIMDKQDLITTTNRWNADYDEIPNRAGQMPDPEKFDAVFFGIHSKQVATMDPMSRTLMEHTYEAIVDAGYHPSELRGKKIAVVIGICYSESERVMLYDRGNQAGGFVVTGCSRAMIPNRITYWLGVHGPSYTVDTACSSSAYALEHCYRMLMSGEIDGAIVGGTNICLHPYITLHFARLGVLSPDGRCKTFDEGADGYVRSDAVCSVFLQRAKDAKRIYATVVHGKTNSDGYKTEGITYPSSKLQTQLLSEFYEECKIPTTDVGYLEAHGTGTKVGDPEEMVAIDTVLCKGRTTPLKVGSIKSNLGHSEPVSCLCSVSKVIIAMETGILPPNINYNCPRKSITAIQEGRLEVVTEQTPWESGYAAINTFGFGGANAHFLLKANPKTKVNNGAPTDDLPRVVVVSGRTEEAVNSLLDAVEEVGLDVEYIRLLHDVHVYNTPKHLHRGYTVLGSKHTVGKIREITSYNDDSNRPVWFIFSGMGSQWPGMGKMLMRFPVFAKAIEKCDAVLRPRGLDIVEIITTSDKTIFNNILHCFVGIAAVQIGLVDLLTAVGIVPDAIIGHSVGELGCAYSDGCFTAEEMILSAYARGLASIECEMIHGAMAAIGLGSQVVEAMCPADIDVACHNSNSSCTISGPSASIKEFVAKLSEKKIFAREVASGEIAYHSRYIAKAGSKLLAYLREFIPEPKVRSSKWLSTSLPEKDWSTAAAKYSSPEYHTNNLLSAVLFEETAKHIPNNAICIEIAPHGLLQAILKRSLAPETTNVPLTLRGHADNAEFFIQALGKLYNVGLQPKLANIYPPVSFPVSRGTPMISPHIKWDHAVDYYVAYFDDAEKIASGERTVEVTTSDAGMEYLTGHVIDGRNLVPAMGYIAQIWETIAMMKRSNYTSLPIVFEDVRFERATTVPPEGIVLKLTIMIHKGTGNFEILENDVAVVNGKMRVTSNAANDMVSDAFLQPSSGDEDLSTEDIYKELKIRGYEYQGMFRSLTSAAMDGSKGHIAWHNNYPTFMDNMMQLKIFGTDKRALYVPTSIRKLVIDTKKHQQLVESMEDPKKGLPVIVNKDLDVISAGGVQIFGLIAKSIPRRKLVGIPVIEEYKFVPHRDRAQVSLNEMTILSSHLAFDAQPMVNVKILEIVEEQEDIQQDELISPALLSAFKDLPLVQPVAHLATSEKNYESYTLPSDVLFIAPDKLPSDNSMYIASGRNLLTAAKEATLKKILLALRPDGFILTEEDSMPTSNQLLSLNVIFEKCRGNKMFLLLKNRSEKPKQLEVVTVNSNSLDWLEKTKEIVKSSAEKGVKTRLILVTQADKECGILGMVNCLRKEPGGEIVRAVIIQDENAPKFNYNDPFYYQQLQLDLPINILEGGQWGSYRHLPLPAPEPKLYHHAFIEQQVRGDLSSFRWVEGPIKPMERPEDQIRVAYVALNFKDVMVATGRIGEEVITQKENTNSTHSLLGFEFSGMKPSGDRVMGFLTVCGISNIYYPDTNVCWRVPDAWSLEDAATVPAVYGTAVYALYIVDRIKKGEKILIHSGTGGVGQAAIHLAILEGLEVFTTVGTPEKRRFIHERFPTIPDDHIGNSRDLSFEHMIMQQTNGCGVDIVLNSLAEDKLLASVRCLKRHGRFLEIGKYDIAANNPLNMMVFLKEVSFQAIMLDYTLAEGDSSRAPLLAQKVQEFLDEGRIQPINRKIFDKGEVETAIRYMGAGKHIGKVLIKMQEEKGMCDKPILAYPRFYCSRSASYIIFGGLGGLGLEVAEWLISRSAQNIVLVSRRGITTGYQKLKVHQWRLRNINVQVIKGKEGWKRADCEYILKEAAKMGPVDAIFNLAVQLKDAIITNQTIESFEESLKPKVGITKQLDQLSRTLCPELRYFVVFSSASCGRGTPGQTNYGYGNAVMERICERRVAEGLPGLAIQWGAVGEVGLVANMQKDNKDMNIGGTLQQKVSSCMQEMERFLMQKHPVVSSMVVAEKKKSSGRAENPLQAVLAIMGVKNVESMNKDTPLIELGMDSMLAVEIKETLERDFDVFLTPAEMRTLNYRRLISLSGDKKTLGGTTEDSKTDSDSTEENDDVFWKNSQVLSALTTIVENTTTCIDFPIPNDKSKRRIFLIPGLEGSFNAFSTILGDLKYSTTCLQFPHSDDYRSIPSLAEYLLPYMLPKLSGVSEIILVGYSLGSLVAFEIAKKLERLGHKLHIVCIDGVPSAIKKLAIHNAKSTSESHIHNRALLSIAGKIMPSAVAQFSVLLEKFETLDEKLEMLAASFDLPQVPIKYQKAVAGAICRRTYASHMYEVDATPVLTSPITLLKATKGLTKMPDACHGLEGITKGAIKELTFLGDHITILEDKAIAAAINDLVN